jgi:hypothetical protein
MGGRKASARDTSLSEDELSLIKIMWERRGISRSCFTIQRQALEALPPNIIGFARTDGTTL